MKSRYGIRKATLTLSAWNRIFAALRPVGVDCGEGGGARVYVPCPLSAVRSDTAAQSCRPSRTVGAAQKASSPGPKE